MLVSADDVLIVKIANLIGKYLDSVIFDRGDFGKSNGRASNGRRTEPNARIINPKSVRLSWFRNLQNSKV